MNRLVSLGTLLSVLWLASVDTAAEPALAPLLGDARAPAAQEAGASSRSGFPASGVELLSWLPLSEFGPNAVSGADCWGYTSPSGREYAIIGVSSGTGFVDISDPGAAEIVAVIDGPDGLWRDIKVYQDYAYVVSETGGGIQVISMSQIDQGIVSQVGTVTTGGTPSTHNVVINEESGFLYRTGGSGAGVDLGLRIYDLSSPALPVFVGEWNDRYCHDAQVVTYHGGPFDGREIAFCFSGVGAGWEEAGVDILDVTDKSNITPISFLPFTGTNVFSHQGWLSPDRQFLYVNDELDELSFGFGTTMYIHDVSDLTAPALVGTFLNGNSSTDHNLYTKGNLIYAANYTSGLRVYDATIPTAPVEIAYFDTYPEDDLATWAFGGLWSNYPYFDSGVVIGSDEIRGLFVWWIGSPLLTFEYPDGRPDTVEPEGHAMSVRIVGHDGGVLDPSTARLFYDLGSGFVEAPMTPIGGDLFEAQFPAVACRSSITYYVTGQTTSGITWRDPPSAPAEVYTAWAAYDLAVVVTDDMETDTGWVVGDPSDTATMGIWDRIIPDGTFLQPSEDHTDDPGTMCWVTDPVSVGDLNGTTTLTSPPMALAAAANPIVGYWRWFSRFNPSGLSGDDVFRIDISGDGATWVSVETIGPEGPETEGGQWYHHAFEVRQLIAPTNTVRLRFVAEDTGHPDRVVAAIDDLRVIDLDCGFEGVTPSAPPPPFDGPMNRYVAFSPNNGSVSVAFEIALPDGRTAWVGEPTAVDWDGTDLASVSLVVDTPVTRVWGESVVHITGCAVAPDRNYAIRASDGVTEFSNPLELSTVPAPSAGAWADIVGSFDNGSQTWSPPNGFVNFQDIDAAVKKFQVRPTAPHVTVVDLNPQWPNYVVNFSDIDMVIKGFQNTAYPVVASDCQTIANCPLGAPASCLP